MKKVVSFILILLPLMAIAQIRVEETSHKHQPDWINGTEKSYLIVSETAPDIETAKQKILLNLKSQIAETVATKIISESTLSTSQNFDGENTQFQQDFDQYVVSKAANIPFINNISLSKATDYYWKKLYNKKTKTYYYEYHIKYLLMEIDIKKMVDEFQQHEQELSQTLNDFENNLDAVTSVEMIDRNISNLKTFRNEFETGDIRYIKAEQLINDYQKLYKNITIEEVKSTIGSVNIRLTLNGKPITTAQMPKITSNCANQFNTRKLDEVLSIDFDFFDCYDDDSNWINIQYKLGSNFVSKKIFIKMK
ncbi:MAG: hypothetical protein PHR53_07600 [Bacteroidales bacterium]|nr:hypothetical protein [Bacteroidales bacterium]